MKVLYCKCFGLGNAVMAIPAIRAFSEVFGPIDVLIGTTPDDVGAADVFLELRNNYPGIIDQIWFDAVPLHLQYDLAVLAIPFDGRWREGVHYNAKRSIDARPRPGDHNVLGLDSWKMHEAVYQLRNLEAFGLVDGIPESRFLSQRDLQVDENLIYLGIGFKRDRDNFWSKKHWGNERYAEFIREVTRLRPGTKFITTAGQVDTQVAAELSRQTGISVYYAGLPRSFPVLAKCKAYFGNDTGMAHVAASMERPTYMMIAFPGSEIKNPPLCARSRCEQFHTDPRDPQSVAADFIDFVWGDVDA